VSAPTAPTRDLVRPVGPFDLVGANRVAIAYLLERNARRGAILARQQSDHAIDAWLRETLDGVRLPDRAILSIDATPYGSPHRRALRVLARETLRDWAVRR
jgi:hypothetical protein